MKHRLPSKPFSIIECTTCGKRTFPHFRHTCHKCGSIKCENCASYDSHSLRWKCKENCVPVSASVAEAATSSEDPGVGTSLYARDVEVIRIRELIYKNQVFQRFWNDSFTSCKKSDFVNLMPGYILDIAAHLVQKRTGLQIIFMGSGQRALPELVTLQTLRIIIPSLNLQVFCVDPIYSDPNAKFIVSAPYKEFMVTTLFVPSLWDAFSHIYQSDLGDFAQISSENFREIMNVLMIGFNGQYRPPTHLRSSTHEEPTPHCLSYDQAKIINCRCQFYFEPYFAYRTLQASFENHKIAHMNFVSESGGCLQENWLNIFEHYLKNTIPGGGTWWPVHT